MPPLVELLEEYGSMKALNRAIVVSAIQNYPSLKVAAAKLGVNEATLWKWRKGASMRTRAYRRKK